MVWRTFGREGMAARIREHMRLAQLFAAWMEKEPRLELRAPVVMGVVCFAAVTHHPKRSAESCRRIVEEINASGRAYLTLTELRGATAIRLGLGNILTNESHLRAVWQMILDRLH
jgi:aromatic-L-amino-acid decarboxylase